MRLDGHGDNRGLNTSEAPICHQTSGTIASWSMERVPPGPQFPAFLWFTFHGLGSIAFAGSSPWWWTVMAVPGSEVEDSVGTGGTTGCA